MRAPRWLTSHRRLLAICLAAAIVVWPLGYFWASSLLPSSYSVTDMGYPDYGGGSRGGDQQGEMAGMAGMHRMPGMPSTPEMSSVSRSVETLTVGTDRPADVLVTLTARKQVFTLAGGRSVDGYTLNGTSPGPEIRALQGQLLEVRLINESVPDGITVHWHGLDVPNADDGVAGVTQNSVPVGGEFVYRFLLSQAGTYWYHSHQVSHEQVVGGLLGALVISPAAPAAAAADRGTVVDEIALAHIYDGRRTINGRDDDVPIQAPPGARVRVRIINTDNGAMLAWVAGAPFTLVAVDGTDLNEPGRLTDRAVQVTAGGRADLEIVQPADGSIVRVVLGGSNSLLLGSGGAPAGPVPAVGAAPEILDPLSYGAPAPLGLNPDAPDRSFDYSIGRRPGLVGGVPGLWWTINGHLFPDVPMFVVADGDVVRMRISNDSGEVHPMHLHGHHAVVVSRNGVPATGSPWWVDSLTVADGESYDIAFRADNPGIWMDHCHNLPHATQGLVAHLMYEGVTEPFLVGADTGNQPE